jgi:AraC-like DNA-binding protein
MGQLRISLVQNGKQPLYCRGGPAGPGELRLVECGYSPRKARAIMSPQGRTLPHTSVHLVAGGSGTLATLGGETHLQAGTALVLRRGVWHRFDPDPGSYLEEWWFALAGGLPCELADAVAPGRAALVVANPDRLRVRFAALLALARPPVPAAAWRAATYAYDLLAEILAGGGQAGAEDDVAAAMAVLQSGCAERSSPLPAFLRERQLSADAFRRRFSARTGRPPHAFWLQAKLALAQGMLVGTALPIGEIAAAVGLPDQGWFTQWFRRATGMSPGAWRARHDGDGAVPPPAMPAPIDQRGPPPGSGSAGLYRGW